MLRTRPTFEAIARQRPSREARPPKYPYTDYSNSPAYVSLTQNQQQLESHAEVMLKQQEFDSVMRETAKEYGVPPQAMRETVKQANEGGFGGAVMRLFRRRGGEEEEVAASSSPPPPPPPGGQKARRPEPRQQQQEQEPRQEPYRHQPPPPDEPEEIDVQMRRPPPPPPPPPPKQVIGYQDGVPLYRFAPQPMEAQGEPDLSVLLGPSHRAVRSAFVDMLREGEGRHEAAQVALAERQRAAIAEEIELARRARLFVEEVSREGRQPQLLPGLFDAIRGVTPTAPISATEAHWLARLKRATSPRDVMLALSRSGMSPEEMLRVSELADAHKARSEARQSPAGRVAAGLGAVVRAIPGVAGAAGSMGGAAAAAAARRARGVAAPAIANAAAGGSEVLGAVGRAAVGAYNRRRPSVSRAVRALSEGALPRLESAAARVAEAARGSTVGAAADLVAHASRKRHRAGESLPRRQIMAG